MINEKESISRVYIPEQCRKEMRVILEKPVTIVQAPMGHGKTVAVKEFLEREEVKIIWIDLKHCVNDRWWDYFCSEVRNKFPDEQDLYDEIVRRGRPGNGQTINHVIRIINFLKPDYPLVYVIDNFHLAFNQLVPSLIEMSAEKSACNTHVVLLSRNTYSGMFGELRRKGKLAILDRDLFLFRENDIVNYFRLYDIDLSAEAAGDLLNLTEGWINALYLILTRSTEDNLLAIPQTIYEIIDFGWFSKLTEQEAELLYHVVLLGDFSFEQVQFVYENKSGDSDIGLDDESDEEPDDKAYRILSGLTRENAFLSYDEEKEQYHIHQIVRRFLCRQVKRLPQIKRRQIHQIWGDWYYQQDDYYQAMLHYMESGDYAAILESMTETGNHQISTANWSDYQQLIQTCPEAVMEEYPEAAAILTLFSLLVGDYDSYNNLRALIDECLELPGDGSDRRAILESNLKVVEMLEVYNDIGRMNVSLAEIKEPNSCLRALLHAVSEAWTWGCFSYVLMFWNRAGGLQEDIRQAGVLLEYFRQHAPGCGAGGRQIMEAEWLLQKGDFIGAEAMACEGELWALREREAGNVISAKIIRLQIAVLTGKEKIRMDLKHEIRKLLYDRRGDHARLQMMFELYVNDEMDSDNDHKEISYWWENENGWEQSVYFPSYPLRQILYGRYLLMREEYTKILDSFQRMVNEEFYGRHLLFLVWARIFLAVSHYQTNKHDMAERSLAKAMEIAAGDQICLPFAEYYGQLWPMIDSLKEQGPFQSFIGDIEALVTQIKT